MRVAPPGGPRGAVPGSLLGHLPLLLITFWIGFNLRAAILGVPPVLSVIRADLHLTYTEVGLLSGLPILAFAAAALPASALVRRWGGYLVVALGLALAAIGELLRVVPGGVLPLFLGTALMGTGIALTQPGMPALFQRWFRGRVQTASVTLTLGITMGELVAASVSRPVLYAGLRSWQATMVVWGLLGVSCLLVWLLGVPRLRVGLSQGSAWELGSFFGSLRLWAVYICFGGQSLVFFAANTWIPSSVQGGPHSALASLSLAVLNGAMVPVDVGLILLRRAFATSRWFYVLSGLVTLVGSAGWLWFGHELPLLFAALMGVGVAMNFAGLLAYPPLVAGPGRVATMSAVMLTVGYSCAFCGPLLGGVAIDLGGGDSSPFIPIAVAAAIMVVAATQVSPHLPPRMSGQALKVQPVDPGGR